MSGITTRRVSANWHRGCGSSAPGVRVDVVQPRLVGVPGHGRKSVGGYNDLPDSSHGHPLRRGGGDRCKRCPSAALCVSCLSCGESSQCPSYNSQKPFSSCAEAVEHNSFPPLEVIGLSKNAHCDPLMKGNPKECERVYGSRDTGLHSRGVR